jgi:hypothetical protein
MNCVTAMGSYGTAVRRSTKHSHHFICPHHVSVRLAKKINRMKMTKIGDANPAHLPRLGSLLCTWIRAGHLGSLAGQPGSGAPLSQLGERVGR